MPVTVVVGGQFGSEGKGKVAGILAREQQAAAVVRVGGPNSGHTPDKGGRQALQQLPTAAYEEGIDCVLPPGSFIDLDILEGELARTHLDASRLKVSPFASVISPSDRLAEVDLKLTAGIGSTGSGTGAAVWRRAMRAGEATLARDLDALGPYLTDTTEYLRGLVDTGRRVIIEGTQGFGLSVLHGGHYPYATSRDTTAAGALAEAGLSPLDVDDVTLVVRAFPIRVGGNSGPLPNELTWEQLSRLGNHDHELSEYTTVTRRLRRVAQFDPDLVTRAIRITRPTCVILNHLDYVDHDTCRSGRPTERINDFVRAVQESIGRPIDRLGIGPGSLTAVQTDDEEGTLFIPDESPSFGTVTTHRSTLPAGVAQLGVS